MFNESVVSVEIDNLRQFMEEILGAAGCDEAVARELAEVHLEADLRGVGVQGLNHLINSHQAKLRSGEELPSAQPEIAEEGTAYAIIDGHGGPGPIAAMAAVRLASKKARESGCAAVGVRNSHDLYMAGFYADRIASEGQIGIVFSDDVVPVVHPIGGSEPVIGSNPMAISAPTLDAPFLADFSPIETLPTYIRYAKRYNEEIPSGVAVDRAGDPTTDPEKVSDGKSWQPEQGAISPLGTKGYGLLLAIELLSGALLGCDMGTDHVSKPESRKGHLIVAIDVDSFGDLDRFRRAASERFQQVRGSRPAGAGASIRVPGDGTAERRGNALKSGVIRVDSFCWKDALLLADDLGIDAPQLSNQSD